MRPLTVVLSVVSAVCAPCFAGQPENAALWYWRAFAFNPALMMTFDSPLHEHLRDIDTPDWQPTPEAESAIDGLDEMIDEFVRGAQKETCDFGVDHSQGPNLLLPHLSPLRLLTKAALADARMCLNQKQSDHAQTLVVSCLRASRHLSSDGLSVSSIVSASMLQSTLVTIKVGLDANAWDESHLKHILDELSKFDAPDPTQLQSATIGAQRHLIEWMRADLANGGAKSHKFISSIASLGQNGSVLIDERPLQVTPTMLDQYARCLDAANTAWSAANPADAVTALEQRIADDEFGPLTRSVAESLRRPLRERDEVARHLSEITTRIREKLQSNGAPPKSSPPTP